MRMKGYISPIIAIGAISLIMFVSMAAINNNSDEETFVRMQLAKENKLQTENLIRMLDKAFEKDIYNQQRCATTRPSEDFSNNDLTIFNTVLGNYNTETMECNTNNINISNSPNFTLTTNLDCTTSAAGIEIKNEKEINFRKTLTTNTDGTCSVGD